MMRSKFAFAVILGASLLGSLTPAVAAERNQYPSTEQQYHNQLRYPASRTSRNDRARLTQTRDRHDDNRRESFQDRDWR